MPLAIRLARRVEGSRGAWSGHGRRLAFWSSVCLNSSGGLFDATCYQQEAHLQVTDARGLGDQIVAVAHVGR